MKRPSAERIAEFTAAARRLAVERIDAADLVTQLLRDTPRENWMSLAERPELQTNGALEQVSREIENTLRHQPKDSLPLSALAVRIADSLADDQYPAVVMAQIRAHAWKDRAKALTYNGKHEESLAAIQRAEVLLDQFGTVAHDQAIVALTKAIALLYVGRFDEALSALEGARATFAAHGDEQRVVLCGITMGVVYYRRGDNVRARDTFRALLPIAQVIGDDFSLASLHNNLACTLLELGEFRDANIQFSNAIARCNEAGRKVDALRTEMSCGRLFLAKGKTAEGIERLRSARDQFLAHGLAEEAGICGLDIAGALLSEYRHDDAEEIAQLALHELRDTNLSPRARTALEYLERELAAHDATVDVVRHVRDYIESLQSNPDREFIALR
jgi:tetratricopeptide (TPR) repeat protein